MEKLGIDPLAIIFQIVNFGVLVFLLNKFLYKPVLKAIRNKNESLEKMAEDKAKIETEKLALEAEREDSVKSSMKSRDELVRESRVAAEKLKKEVLLKAESRAKRILEKAEKEVQAEKAKLYRDYKKDVLEAAVAIVEKVTGESEKAKIAQVKASVLKDVK